MAVSRAPGRPVTACSRLFSRCARAGSGSTRTQAVESPTAPPTPHPTARPRVTAGLRTPLPACPLPRPGPDQALGVAEKLRGGDSRSPSEGGRPLSLQPAWPPCPRPHFPCRYNGLHTTCLRAQQNGEARGRAQGWDAGDRAPDWTGPPPSSTGAVVTEGRFAQPRIFLLKQIHLIRPRGGGKSICGKGFSSPFQCCTLQAQVRPLPTPQCQPWPVPREGGTRPSSQVASVLPKAPLPATHLCVH